MKKTVYVVAHTHWDHEWYFTQEDSDIILVENLDFLITTLEKDKEFTCYSFDGQFSVIEKYLKIRPENTNRVKQLIKSKRLFIGPWYTQADALLGKTESLIRNLLYGVKYSESFGHSMNIGYAPDIFGQHMYLPSIYKRFGIDYSIFQRGLYNDQVKENLNFWWESPNKEKIMANNIFYGYGPGKFLSDDSDYVTHRLNPILKELGNKNKDTDNILLPAGGDQVIINSEFTEIVKKLNQLSQNYQFILSDFESYMKDTWNNSEFKTVYLGEFLASQKSRIHNTCRSERYDIKKLNYEVENELINELEPLYVIAETFNIPYPQKWIDQIWKKIFDSQAHNGIGASNSDDANHDIVVRLTSAHRQVKDLINLVKKQLTEAISRNYDLVNPVVLFNTTIKKNLFNSEIVLFTQAKNFSLETITGTTISYDILEQEELDGGKKIIVTSLGEKEEKVSNYYRTRLLVREVTVPALGFTTLKVSENKKGLLSETKSMITDTIQNQMFKLNFKEGILTLMNKETGMLLENPFTFDDTADAGDSFDYSPLKGDTPIVLKKAVLKEVKINDSEEAMVLSHRIKLPRDLADSERNPTLAEFEILTTICLRKNETFLRIHHDIDNQIKDHRVRVNWLTNVKDNSVNYADQGFSLVKRSSDNPYLKNWRKNKFVEKPMPIYPLENVVAVADEASSFMIHTGMLKEYQVLPKSRELSLTLFRSNGLLGRDDLEWRPGRASGINNKVVTTPDGQMLTKMTFDYFVSYTNEGINEQLIYEKIDQFETKKDYYQIQSLNTYEHRIDRFSVPKLKADVPNEFSLFQVENKNIFMSSLKKGWDEGIIVRFYNPTKIPQSFDIGKEIPFNQIEIVNLKEETIAKIAENLTIPAKDYVTLKLMK